MKSGVRSAFGVPAPTTFPPCIAISLSLIAIQGGKVVGAGTPKALLTPDFIKKLYDVDCEIHYGEDERMNIVYIPQHWKK